MSKRLIQIKIDAEEKACGYCIHPASGSEGRIYCDVFYGRNGMQRLRVKAGRPQRCAACKNAEVKDDARRHLDQ